MGLKGVVQGMTVQTTTLHPAALCPLDRVNRQFKAPRPNALWVSEFTYVATWFGFVYVAFVVDVFARRIVGWRVSRTAHPAFVLDALEQALHERRPLQGGALVHHSDRGSQYVSIRYTKRLLEAGIEPSVGSAGDSYDNALAETVIGLFKTEVIRRRGPWRSMEAVEFATLEWVAWFNHQRLLGPIGNIPPAVAEARYHAQAEAPALAASPKPNSLRQTRSGSNRALRRRPAGAPNGKMSKGVVDAQSAISSKSLKKLAFAADSHSAQLLWLPSRVQTQAGCCRSCVGSSGFDLAGVPRSLIGRRLIKLSSADWPPQYPPFVVGCPRSSRRASAPGLPRCASRFSHRSGAPRHAGQVAIAVVLRASSARWQDAGLVRREPSARAGPDVRCPTRTRRARARSPWSPSAAACRSPRACGTARTAAPARAMRCF